MFVWYAALLLASGGDSTRVAPAPDTTKASEQRVVRRFEEVVVRASRLPDPFTAQSIHRVSREDLSDLPIDGVSDALALQPGVVATAQGLHVRGGRPGEAQAVLQGIPLAEPLRGRSMDVPRLGLESADVVTGGLDAAQAGALAGVITLRTRAPSETPQGDVSWNGDLGYRTAFFDPTRYDRWGLAFANPLPAHYGAVVAGEVTMDDTPWPALRPRSSWRSWQASNHVLGLFKLAPLGGAQGMSLDLLGSREVEQPFDPMWTLDGYTTPCSGPNCTGGPAFSDEPLPGYERYRAADHLAITDEGRWAAVLSGWRAWQGGRLRGALGWVGARRLVAVGGRDDESYLTSDRAPIFGLTESATSSPFLVYHGDEPFFQRSRAETYTLRGDWETARNNGARAGGGAGLTWDHVAMRELDVSLIHFGLDSLRAFRASAPGAFAYGQARWVFEGMVLNAGIRLEGFTAGPEAEHQSFGAPPKAIWTLSPRFGVAYPVSVRDVLSLAYSRVAQSPARDFLYDNRSWISRRQPLGNPSLEPSTAIAYQVAVQHLFERGRAVQAALFYRDLYDQIGVRDFHTPAGPIVPRYENADEGHAEGLELTLLLPWSDAFEVSLGYTYMHAGGSESQEEGRPFGSSLGPRAAPISELPLDWDRRHSAALAWIARHGKEWTLSWTTQVGSGLPWTASPRRQELTDLSRVNAERLPWDETTSTAFRWGPPFLPSLWHVTLGVEVHNVFDHRGETAATISGYPNPLINTVYDDYGAYRAETGLDGGAYWDANDPNAANGWVPVHDPRLFQAPRAVRFSIDARW